MEDMVVLEMLVNRSVADELSQKRLAEIALRRTDSKFKALVKCRILGDKTLSDELVHNIQSSALKKGLSNTTDLSTVRNTMRTVSQNIEANLLNLSSTAKNLSVQVDSIYQLSNAIKTISFVNTGISLANLAVDVAGFVIINRKLNVVNSEIKTVINEIQKLSDIVKNEKISDCQKLIMKYNSLSSKILNSEAVNQDDMENLLIEMKTFISEMIRNLLDNTFDKNLLLDMIYILMPAYTQLFAEYNKRVYYSKQSLPPNYDIFMSLYSELENNDLRQDLQDYYFLNLKMYSQDVIDLLNAKTLVEMNQKVLIEDQVSAMRMLGTGEQCDAFEIELDEFVKSLIQERIPVIAKETGISEIRLKKLFITE